MSAPRNEPSEVERMLDVAEDWEADIIDALRERAGIKARAVTVRDELVAAWEAHDAWALRMGAAWRRGRFPSPVSGVPETAARLDAALDAYAAEIGMTVTQVQETVAAARRSGLSLPDAVAALEAR